MAKEYGINYWDSKSKKTRTRQRYHGTYTTKADAQAEIVGFFCPWEAAHIVKVNVAKSKPPKSNDLKEFDAGVRQAQKQIKRHGIVLPKAEGNKPYVLITVDGGIADIAENAAGVDVDILDFDNLKADDSLLGRLSDREKAYLERIQYGK